MNRLAPYKYHLAALFTVSVWGATFVSTKVLLAHSLTPAAIFFLRFALAYLCIWPLARTRLWASSLRDELLLAAAGVSGRSLYFLAENIALEYAPTSNISLLVCTAPVWTALMMSILYRNERMTRRQTTGSALAFAGMVLVVLNGRFVLHLAPIGDLLGLSAVLLWVAYSVIIKGVIEKYDSFFITRKVLFYGILTILPICLTQAPEIDWSVLAHPAVWGNLVFLGIVASMLCYVLWNIVIQRLGAVRATNYIYLNPLVTILVAALCIGERITLAALAGTGLILCGMWWAERPKDAKGGLI